MSTGNPNNLRGEKKNDENPQDVTPTTQPVSQGVNPTPQTSPQSVNQVAQSRLRVINQAATQPATTNPVPPQAPTVNQAVQGANPAVKTDPQEANLAAQHGLQDGSQPAQQTSSGKDANPASQHGLQDGSQPAQQTSSGEQGVQAPSQATNPTLQPVPPQPTNPQGANQAVKPGSQDGNLVNSVAQLGVQEASLVAAHNIQRATPVDKAFVQPTPMSQPTNVKQTAHSARSTTSVHENTGKQQLPEINQGGLTGAIGSTEEAEAAEQAAFLAAAAAEKEELERQAEAAKEEARLAAAQPGTCSVASAATSSGTKQQTLQASPGAAKNQVTANENPAKEENKEEASGEEENEDEEQSTKDASGSDVLNEKEINHKKTPTKIHYLTILHRMTNPGEGEVPDPTNAADIIAKFDILVGKAAVTQTFVLETLRKNFQKKEDDKDDKDDEDDEDSGTEQKQIDDINNHPIIAAMDNFFSTKKGVLNKTKTLFSRNLDCEKKFFNKFKNSISSIAPPISDDIAEFVSFITAEKRNCTELSTLYVETKEKYIKGEAPAGAEETPGEANGQQSQGDPNGQKEEEQSPVEPNEQPPEGKEDANGQPPGGEEEPKKGGAPLKIMYKDRFYTIRTSANNKSFISSKREGILTLDQVMSWHMNSEF
jgi:hypothetical protein